MAEKLVDRIFPKDDGYDDSKYDLLLGYEDGSKDGVASLILESLEPHQLQAVHARAPSTPKLKSTYNHSRGLVAAYDRHDPLRSSQPAIEIVRKEVLRSKVFARLHVEMDAVPLLAYPREVAYSSNKELADTAEKKWDIFLLSSITKEAAVVIDLALRQMAEFVVDPEAGMPNLILV